MIRQFFTSENNDIANQSVDTSFFTSEKNRMTNQLPFLAQRDYFYLDPFWSVNLGTYIIIPFISPLSILRSNVSVMSIRAVTQE